MYKTAKSPSTKALTIVNKSTLYKSVCGSKRIEEKICFCSFLSNSLTLSSSLIMRSIQLSDALISHNRSSSSTAGHRILA